MINHRGITKVYNKNTGKCLLYNWKRLYEAIDDTLRPPSAPPFPPAAGTHTHTNTEARLQCKPRHNKTSRVSHTKFEWPGSGSRLGKERLSCWCCFHLWDGAKLPS